jgi:hypothetical protein
VLRELERADVLALREARVQIIDADAVARRARRG